MSLDKAEFLEDLTELLKRRNRSASIIVDTNLKIGKLLCERYKGEETRKLFGIAMALAKKQVYVSPKFLFDAHRVYSQVRGKKVVEELKKHSKNLTWYALVNEYTSPPKGEKEAEIYWENFLYSFEHTQDRVDFLIQHFGELPEKVKLQAEGLLMSLGYSFVDKLPKAGDEVSIRKRVRKIAHIADEHFDDSDRLPDVVSSGRAIVERLYQEMPDLIISSGDLVHARQSHDSPALRHAIEFIRELANIAPVFILKGTTSHDGTSIELFQNLNAKHNVYVSEKVGLVGFRAGEFFSLAQYEKGLDALILSLPPLSKAQMLLQADLHVSAHNTTVQELIRNIFMMWGPVGDEARADEVMTILSCHGTLQNAVVSTGQYMIGRDVEFSIKDVQRANADVVCLGHIHKAQRHGNIFYSGSIAKQNIGEIEQKGFWVHERTEKGLKSEFMVVPTRDIIQAELQVPYTLDQLPPITPQSTVRVTCRAVPEDIHLIDEQELKEHIHSLGASEVRVEKAIVPKESARASGISKALTLADKAKMYCDLNETQFSEAKQKRIEMVQKPLDMICEELGIEPPKRRKKQ